MNKLIVNITILILLFLNVKEGYAQCFNCSSQYPAATQTTTSTSLVNVSTCMWGGDYAVFDVTAGETYTWTTCANGAYDTQLTLFQGASCGGTDLDDNDDDCGLQSTITWTATFTGQVSVLVSEYNCVSNSDCMDLDWACTSCGTASSVPNDDPCNATPLTVNSGCSYTSDDNSGATDSGIADPGCGSYSGGDVWFEFTVPASGDITIQTQSGGVTDGAMALYSGANCSSLTLLDCDDDGGTSLMPEITYTGLTPGETMWVRFWEYSNDNQGSFDICIVEDNSGPISAQDCGGGTTVCSDATFSGNSSGSGATQELDASNQGCLDVENQSSWYFFSPQTSGTIEFTINTTVDYDFAIWGPMGSANCPPSSAPIRCSYAAGGNPTGLSSGSGDQSEGAGGDGFVDPLNVSAGEVYIMVIDNYTADGTSFDLDWSLSGGANLDCTVLDIELLSFQGKKVRDQVSLEWTTMTETNSDHFIIEKANSEGDFSFFKSIKSRGGISKQTYYSLVDDNPFMGTSYYRLKEVTTEGDITTYKTISIEFGEASGFSIFPNPANTYFNVVNYDAIGQESVKLELIDIYGKVIKTSAVQNWNGKFKFNTSDLKSGVYSLRISSRKILESKKVIIK